MEPKLIVGLEGKGIVEVAIGPTHAAGISDGGDLYGVPVYWTIRNW